MFFGHGDMGIAEEDGSVGPILRVEVGGMRLVTAHMMGRYHALVLLDPVVT